MPSVLRVRRIVLVLIALAFLGVAIGTAVAPQSMAGPIGYKLDNPNALNEFRAVYLGLFLGFTILYGWAARRIEKIELGDVGALLLLTLFFGRLVSVALDGMPETNLVLMAVTEPLGGFLLLWFRPSTR